MGDVHVLRRPARWGHDVILEDWPMRCGSICNDLATYIQHVTPISSIILDLGGMGMGWNFFSKILYGGDRSFYEYGKLHTQAEPVSQTAIQNSYWFARNKFSRS